MISYELAKQLKDAGFPQDYASLMFESNRPDTLIAHSDEDCYCPRCVDSDFYKVPSLSELIAACKEMQNHYNYEFILTITPEGRCFAEFDWLVPHQEGNTLEEAVAHLWLALNKKENE